MAAGTLGIIPARGGSKGIARKNIAMLGGKPLVAYTCTAARASRLDGVILSSEDAEIIEVAAQWGVPCPLPRPLPLAGDDTPILPVLVDLLDRLGEAAPETVVLLQPTSPFRTTRDIDAAMEVLEASGADCVVSVVEIPHAMSPVSAMRLEDGMLKPFLEDGGPMILRRQDKPQVFARNGPAILAIRSQVLRSGRLYGDRVAPYVMNRFASLDIDTPDDLRLAEALLASGCVQ